MAFAPCEPPIIIKVNLLSSFNFSLASCFEIVENSFLKGFPLIKIFLFCILFFASAKAKDTATADFAQYLETIEIENGAFYNTGIESLVISKKIQRIGENAFEQNLQLKSVTFETDSELEIIEEKVFKGCSSLTSITLHDNYNEVKDCIEYDINWGDWKHEHLRSKWLLEELFEKLGIVANINSYTTEEDGSDTYSAHYTVRATGKVNEKLEESTNKFIPEVGMEVLYKGKVTTVIDVENDPEYGFDVLIKNPNWNGEDTRFENIWVGDNITPISR